MARKKKEIPQSFTVQIRGKDWLIRLATQEQMQEIVRNLPTVGREVDEKSWSVCYGVCFRSIRVIAIDPGIICTPILESTIGHELVHALLDPLGQLEDYEEELIADVMSEDIWSVFRQVTHRIPLEWLPD